MDMIKIFAFAGALTASVQVLAEPAGKVLAVAGSATIERAGQAVTIQAGQPVESGDVLAVGAGSALQVRGVAVEKVLLGPASEYASVSGASARLKVPFDAQLWLVLGPRAQDSGLTQAIDDAQTRGAPGGDEAAEQAHQ